MKVTFPHMGNLSISAKTLLTELGLEVIPPPPITKRTLELGSKYAPENACLPLKYNLGKYIEALEQGVETIIMIGGQGPCRFGYYGEVQRKILADLGYDFEMIIIESPQGDWKRFYRHLKLILGSITWSNILAAWKRAWVKAQAVDKLGRLVNSVRPYLKRPDQGTKVYKQGLAAIDEAESVVATRKVINKSEQKFTSLEQKSDFRPLKVGMIGEIYILLEPFTNFELEKKLGERGILVNRSIYLTDWIKEHLFPPPFQTRTKEEQLRQAAEPYLNHPVGGHGLESIGETVLYARDGYDGIIHLAPFTCMPEIVADSILPVVSDDLDIPVFSVSIDEHTGEAGFITRLEAFVDLLTRRRDRKGVG